MHCTLLAGVAVLCLTLPYLVQAQRVQTQSLPSDASQTECRRRLFWIWIDKDFFGSSLWQLEALNKTGFIDVMTPPRAAQCGYTITNDVFGNIEVRISFLGCWVNNTNDKRFDVYVQFRVLQDVGITLYPLKMACQPTDVWDDREMVCEENYIEVSVVRIFPATIIQSLQLASPLSGIPQRWQVVFTVNDTVNIISAKDAISRGYGVNATLTRVVFRAPYDMPESQVVMVGSYHIDLIVSDMKYTQTLLTLDVNTTMACPNDPPVVLGSFLSWQSPTFLSPLVTGSIVEHTFAMGINGKLLSNDELKRSVYKLEEQPDGVPPDTVAVTVPIGAPGGNTESDILNNTYVTTYRINLMLQRQWLGLKDEDPTLHTHTQYKPVVAPIIQQIPVFIDHTIKEGGYFNVSLGNFYSDVSLKSFVLDHVPVPLTVLTPRGMTVMTAVNPNNTQVFYLTVPFSDPLVEKKYLGGTSRRYTLYVTYVLTLVPKQKDFTYTGRVEVVLDDVVPPTFSGKCLPDRLVVDVKRGNLDLNWHPYIRDIPLTSELIASQNMIYQSSDTQIHLEVPFPSIGLIYEAASLIAFDVRLVFNFLDNKTQELEMSFSVECSFPPPTSPVCLSNGSMIVVVDGSFTRPPIDAQKTHLKDPACKPQEADKNLALFNIPGYSCGTIRKFDSNYLIYENEVMYERSVLFPNQPIISRDSTYRLTIRCRYPLRDTKWLSGQYKMAPALLGLAVPPQARVLRRRAGSSNVEMRIAKDETYSLFYQPGEFPISVQPEDTLYIQAVASSRAFVPVLQHCWAKSSSSMEKSSHWDLVLDGCVTTDTPFSTVIQMTPDNVAHLQVTLDGEYDRQLYVSCEVSLCNPRLYTSSYHQTCSQTTEQKAPSSCPTLEVSVGPIKISLQSSGIAYKHIGKETWNTWSWTLPLGLGFIAALTLGAILLAVRLFAR
ncbi:uncharacterized protein [Hyperolius riggenbachi]|uniref:uncharacterized protein isoform X2 n=1 Tax=Hyperolius riggenbachi TaxID=752182 RepID=UPI0035A3BC1D